METKQSVRIQTSLINGVEKKALIRMAHRLPKWVSCDMMIWTGLVGAILIGLVFALIWLNIYWLWLVISPLADA